MAHDYDQKNPQGRAVLHDQELVLDPPAAGPVFQQVPPECIPEVTAIDPPQSLVLRDVTISGRKLMPSATTCGSVNTSPVVTFLDSHPGGPLEGAVLSSTDTQIVVRVPNGAKSGQVKVANTRGFETLVPGGFIVLPTIDSFAPTEGGVNTAVQITGSALYNTPQFFFTGKQGTLIPTAFSNPTLTTILVAVPPGAITGPITVMTKGGGMARSMGVFTVSAAVPQVADIKPRSATPGSKVSLFATPGTKFEAVRSVSFLADPDAVGRARRIMLGPSEFAVLENMTRIDALVPLGAVTGKVRVTNDSGSGASPKLRIPLASPGLLVARFAAGPQVELSWRDMTTTEAGFRLERSNGELDGGYMVIATLGPNTVSYVDNSVTAGSTYRYRLVAFNGIDDDSAPSNAAIITVGTSVRLNPVRMLFSAVRDSASPPPQALSIARAADATEEVAWSVSDDTPWLSVLPGSGSTPGTAMVAVDTFGLKAGRYTGLVTVRSGTTVATEPVELTVAAPPGAIMVVIDPE